VFVAEIFHVQNGKIVIKCCDILSTEQVWFKAQHCKIILISWSFEVIFDTRQRRKWSFTSVADPAIGVGVGLPPPHTPLPKIWRPAGRTFQTIHESLPSLACKHIFFINMRNSLLRLLILFDVFEELQLIY